jgi:hypothetical protein
MPLSSPWTTSCAIAPASLSSSLTMR